MMSMRNPIRTLAWFTLAVLPVFNTSAAIKLPSIFGDQMVLQRAQEVRVWGWDNPGQAVSVEIAGQKVTTTTGADNRWNVTLAPLETSSKGLEMKVTGSSAVTFRDVLVGEVWLCSGQSNMQWPVNNSDDPGLEKLTARYPQIRLISVPQVGTQEPQVDFEGSWQPCTPETVGDFSAVGYFFGRLLHQALDVPVGLIDNAWGGSAAEAWVPREVLQADPAYEPYLAQWRQKEQSLEENMEKWQAAMEKWNERAAATKAANKRPPRMPRSPAQEMRGQHRPGNLYNGVLNPIIGTAMRGVI
jgi:sialate O-acetylesterase